MQAIDYHRLLDPDYYCSAQQSDVVVLEQYSAGQGVAYGLKGASGSGMHEVLRFGEDALLLVGDISTLRENDQSQSVVHGDWIHVQFRISGGGAEVVGSGHAQDVEPGSCLIARYPDGSIVDRFSQETAVWRSICLYFRPTLIRDFLRISTDQFAPAWRWLHEDEASGANVALFKLNPAEIAGATDIFQCRFRGDVRRQYIFAKGLELLSHALNRATDPMASRELTTLSTVDAQRISRVHHILHDEMNCQLTLSQLARRVGVNRSKLASGFKELYGESLQAYWRELRLCKARELLALDRMSVTEVAAAVGYADISCLTRSFERRFGTVPKNYKGGTTQSA